MRAEACSNVLKVWLYAGASVLLGTWITPLFYNAGKALAEVVSNGKETNGPLEWLSEICRKWELSGFFEAAMVLSAIFLFFPFVEWLRGGRPAPGSRKQWKFQLPEGKRGSIGGQPLVENRQGIRQFFTGFASVTLSFAVISAILFLCGVFTWKSGMSVVSLVPGTLAGALMLAILQELLFRGIAMGVFLRAMAPAAAIGMSALLFALVHFMNPPDGMEVVDPEASGVGFELLGKIFHQFADPWLLLTGLAPLLALGGILSYARWKTASLYLPIGIHSGFLFTTGLLATTTTFHAGNGLLASLLFGTALKQGLAAFAGILVAGGITIHLASKHDATSIPS